MVICFAANSNANKGSDSLFIPHKHIIKTRVLFPIIDLVFVAQSTNKLVGINYECIIKDRQSFCVSADYIYQAIYTLGGDGNHYNTFTDSYSNGFMFHPEYRIYLNRKKTFPRGFHFGLTGSIGYANGETTLTTEDTNYMYYNGTQVSGGITSVRKSKFSVVIVGVGASIGIQYFIGKRKQFTMDNSIVVYGNKNSIINESNSLGDNYRMYPINSISPAFDVLWTLGYTFGKYESKPQHTHLEETDKWSIGIHGAPSGAIWQGNKEYREKGDLQYQTKLTFLGGVAVEYNIKPTFTLSTEANYERKGSLVAHPGAAYVNGVPVGTLKYNYSFDYLVFPVMGKFKFPKKKVTLYVDAGIYIGYLLKYNVLVYPNEYYPGSKKDGDISKCNRWDMGLVTALGISIPVNDRFQISTEIRNNYGTSSIYKNLQYSNVFNKNESFALRLGLSYKL